MAVRPSRGRAGQGGRWGAPLLTCMLSCDLHRKRRRPPKGSGSHQGAVPGVTAGQARPALRQAVLLPPSGQPPASWSRVSSTPPSHPARPTPLLTPSWSSCSASSEPLAHMIPALSSHPPTQWSSLPDLVSVPPPPPTGKRTSETPAAKRLRLDAGPQSLSGKSTPQPQSGKSTPSSG